MAITANGTTIASVTANGTSMSNVYMNGTLVWSATATQTDAPTINFVRANKSSITVDVTNNDGSSAEIWLDIEPTNPPTTSRGTLASGSTTSDIKFSGLSSGTSYTFYATAQASGETLSTVASASFSTG